MMNIIESIRNAITICMEYCINAIISPTCMLEAATSFAPNQITPSSITFMMSIISGIITTITRLMNKLTVVRSTLALSKRFSSKPCMLKARMTIMPVRFSRATRLMRSVSFWMSLNFGSESEKTMAIKLTSINTATPISHARGESWLMTLIMPPMPIRGA